MNRDEFGYLESHIDGTWKIYIDTCSLYRTVEDGSDFWQRFESLLIGKDAKFTVTTAAFAEFKKHKHSVNHPMKESAGELERILSQYGRAGKNLMLVAGDSGEIFHDNVIVSLIKKRCLTHSQIYITNDLASAWDVFSVVEASMSATRKVKPLLIYKVVSGGALAQHNELRKLLNLSAKEVKEFFHLRSEGRYQDAKTYLSARSQSGDSSEFTKHVSQDRARNMSKSVSFDKAETSIEAIRKKLVIPASYHVCSTGERLKAYRGGREFDVRLGERIGRGGEGFVFEAKVDGGSSSPFLAKIYKKKVVSDTVRAQATLEKISYIVEQNYSNKAMNSHSKFGRSVKFPLMVLATSKGDFVGYLMKKATGISLSKLIADGAVEDEFKKNYPNLTKIDLIDICLNFLEVIAALHRRKIIVGDLNANNVLVDVTSKHVTFLDADSYQYGSAWPCYVGVETYTSPEFLRERDTPFRTVQNELFVVARILFEILMLVDNPYNSRTSTDPVQDMLSGSFRYTFDLGTERITNREAPGEELAIRWGHLSRKLKDAFGNTFHCRGAYWESGKRLDIDQWEEMLQRYRASIARSLDRGDGWESNDVFPKEKKAWVVRYSCACGAHGEQDVNRFVQASKDCRIRFSDDIAECARNRCFACFCSEHHIESIACARCGKPMYAVRSGYSLPMCPECLKKAKSREPSDTSRRKSISVNASERSSSHKSGSVGAGTNSSAWNQASASMTGRQKIVPVEMPAARRQTVFDRIKKAVEKVVGL